MQNKKDTHQDEFEGGDVERDIQHNKFNSADTLANQFQSKHAAEEESTSSKMKKCFIGIMIFLVLLVLIIILAAAAGGSKVVQNIVQGSSAEVVRPKVCPPYHFKNGQDHCVRANCNFMIEIMSPGGGCQRCETGFAVNGMGNECVRDICKGYQFLNQDGMCEPCPDSYLKVAGKCFQADRNKIDMVQTFETNPDFAHYSNVHLTTQNIAMFFDQKSKHFRGPVTTPYTTSGLPVDSPIVPLIHETKIAGNMIYVHQVQEEPKSPYFMDIWFINSSENAAVIAKLSELSNMPGTKCCWTNKSSGESLSTYFTGFARMIEYADYQRNGASPEYAFKITEGQLQRGQIRGFARVISGFEGTMDFGFFNNGSRLQIDQGASELNEAAYMQKIKKLIADNKMVVFTKSYCPYSRALRMMLDENGLEGQYGVYEIDREVHGNEVHKALKDLSGRQTIPNVYLNGENLGGDEEVEDMAKTGELKRKLAAVNLYNTF